VELFINDRLRNRRVRLFNEYALTLRYDSIASGYSFSMYFNPDNPEHKDMLCIGHDHIATVHHNDELLLTGYVMDNKFTSDPARRLVTISGFSKPGFLEDCQIPVDLYPLQFDGMTLNEIAQRLIKPFGLKMIVANTVADLMNEPYEKTTAETTETIKDYLTKLASQKGIVISHTAEGKILFTRANTHGTPILNYGDGGIPCPSMELQFDGNAMHSHIWVVKQADKDGGNAGESLIRNPYVPFVYRPKVLTQSSGNDIDTDKAARTALSAELKGLKLMITTDRWELDGKVIKPNNVITVKNPDVYLYKRSRWFIEQVDFKKDQTSETAVLTCCLPEVYNTDPVKYLFQGINLH
jgi:prophage tail gpP-like protein